MSGRILVVADLKGMAYGRGVKRILKEEMGAGFYSATSLGKNREDGLGRVAADNSFNLSRVVYLGTCAYDLGALLAVRAGGGLSIVLNNSHGYLLNAASIALRLHSNQSAWPIALLAAVFIKWGIRGVIQMVFLAESPQDIQHLMLPPDWRKEITVGLAKSNFRILIQKPIKY